MTAVTVGTALAFPADRAGPRDGAQPLLGECMLKSVSVPARFEPPFARAEQVVESLFRRIDRRPEKGTLHVGEQRYLLMRAESLYHTWFEALSASFGQEAAGEFIYNTAREIGRSDCASFSSELGVTDGVERLASGPVHFAHTGWAFVDILGDSAPATDDSYFLHYYHPNTFESEVVGKLGRKLDHCGCLFSAGYSSGWCSDAFGLEVQGREVRCVGRGEVVCEFIMAPAARLDEHEARVRATWSPK
jgi:activator of aromatic catabolism